MSTGCNPPGALLTECVFTVRLCGAGVGHVEWHHAARCGGDPSHWLDVAILRRRRRGRAAPLSSVGTTHDRGATARRIEPSLAIHGPPMAFLEPFMASSDLPWPSMTSPLAHRCSTKRKSSRAAGRKSTARERSGPSSTAAAPTSPATNSQSSQCPAHGTSTVIADRRFSRRRHRRRRRCRPHRCTTPSMKATTATRATGEIASTLTR